MPVASQLSALDGFFPLGPDAIRQEKIIALLTALLAEQKITNERLGIVGKALLDFMSEPVEPPKPVLKLKKQKDKPI